MLEHLADYGYPAMFLMGFFASSFLPIASEWLLVILVLKGLNPYAVVAAATAGNYAGACTTYLIGWYGSDYTVKKLLKISDETRKRAEKIYAKYGSASLLFSWIPIIGDPLCFVGAVLKVPFLKFSLLVFTGKLIRYGASAYLVLEGAKLIK
jgi:membrane protein YqaA with SNARE-associated domain